MSKRNLKKLALNLPSSSSREKVMPTTPIVMSNSASDQRNTKHTQDMQECTSNIYQQGPACILPNLYLGAYYNALNTTQLTRHGITCVINVASEIDVMSLPQHIEYHHIRWTHSQLDLATSGFERAIALIRTAHDRQQTVMIHCQQGIERSAALVVAFLMKSTRCTKRINAKVDEEDALAGQNWSFDRTLNFVKEKAPKVRPNMELLYQLREYEQSIPIEYQHLYQVSARAEKRHNIRNRTKRSESIACSKPSVTSDTPLTSSTSLRSLKQTMYYQRPRSASVRDSSSSANMIFATAPFTAATKSSTSAKQVNKQPLAIAALIIVLVAMYQRESRPLYSTTHKCKPKDSNDALNTAVDSSDSGSSSSNNNNNRHLGTQFLKPVFPIY
ncbi:conserved hypothetical protein [Mucor ambiguus]|uniref:protein-tyrosine-phosphatase n=1 Tax=Mucor ambiguus TaxID=91626 RepID=A0A0C9MUY0_9FUNG|nr:conserved hypothetical protein [Mucor ambiguus]